MDDIERAAVEGTEVRAPVPSRRELRTEAKERAAERERRRKTERGRS